jgi:hypothetical protein
MTREQLARVWAAGTAAVVLAGLVVQLVATASLTTGRFDSRTERVLNVFCYFTIQSNLIVAVTCALLVAGTKRTSLLFRTLRLDGVLMIAVTFVVYHVALRGLVELSGGAAVADLLLHTVSPVLCVLGWLLFGPRGQIGRRVIGWAVVFPSAWLVFTLIRGPLAGDFYPYPFVDVTEHGYPRVLLNSALVAVLFLALAAGANALDRVLVRRRAPVG